MGNITINGTSKLAISSISTKKFTIYPPIPPMNLTYTYSSNNFYFTIENLYPEIQSKLLSGKKMRFQLVRYARNKAANFEKTKFIKPTFPSYIGAEEGGASLLEEKKANIRIDNFITYNNMNLTLWFTNMIKWGSLNYESNIKYKGISNFKILNGYWYQHYTFCILIDNKIYHFDNAPLFEVRMFNDGVWNINTYLDINTSENIISIFS